VDAGAGPAPVQGGVLKRRRIQQRRITTARDFRKHDGEGRKLFPQENGEVGDRELVADQVVTTGECLLEVVEPVVELVLQHRRLVLRDCRAVVDAADPVEM
jgi:hypothetical protein